MLHAMRRRAFLGRLVAGSAAIASGCVAPPASQTPTTTAPVTPIGTPAPVATPNWDTLAARLRGALITASDGTYDRARVLYNTRFDTIRPHAIARCESVEDVRECVRFARTHRIPLALRSGGHSYGGWSSGTGLVVDVGLLAAIDVSVGRVTVGAGARLIDVYAALSARGAGIAAGSCPSVGITGLTLGGGVGVLTRAWGLTCDDLIATQVVTADAELRDCDETNAADLFWALRGGGGGNFGVVTSLTFRTHPAADLALGFMSWPWSSAATVVRAWQTWMSNAPDGLWSTLHLQTATSGPEVTMHAVLTGGPVEIGRQFDALVASAGAPTYREQGARSYRDVMLLEAGCLGRSVDQCHLVGTTQTGVLQRESYTAKSAIARRPLSNEAIVALVDGIASRSDGGGAVLIDALGGAVAHVAVDATAFPHRDAFAVVQLLGTWGASAPTQVIETTTAWLRGLYAKARPLIGLGAYVNYADPDLPDWASAYYGTNYARLQQVKARYDPDRLFDFPQAVRP